MISVIIPVLNEEATIAGVVDFCWKSGMVDEVIVVDDKSIDTTVERAHEAGAQVITSTKIGKGASMRDGLLYAKSDLLVFLDGDIAYPPETIEKLTRPIVEGKADFVKSTFSRQAGRVTELVAKPLLCLLYPELAGFTQPLSGIIAGKKTFFEKIRFENDYGVDIGILIDMWSQKALITEVNIGAIQNKMKMWRELASMSRDVSRAILRRITSTSIANLDSLGEITIIRDQMEFAIKETLKQMKKMVVFDMDNTLVTGRFIEVASARFGFQKQLYDIIAKNQEPYLITKLIAQLMKGIDIASILQVAGELPIVADAREVIIELKKRGYIVGIISDSYDVVVSYVKLKVGADFSLANELEFSNSIATGEIKVPSFFLRNGESPCSHTYCKTNALIYLSKKYSIPLSNVVAIGDGENDVCMVKYAGVGVAFCSSNNVLNAIADERIPDRSFRKMLELAL